MTAETCYKCTLHFNVVAAHATAAKLGLVGSFVADEDLHYQNVLQLTSFVISM